MPAAERTLGLGATLGGWLGFALAASLALLATFAPIGLAPGGPIGPHWMLIAFAFSAARRPYATPPLLVFAAAGLYEALRDGPFGAELFALLIVTETLASRQRRRPAQSFLEEWARLAAAALALEALVWILLAATYTPTPSLLDLGGRFGATVLVYPIASAALSRLTGARPR